MKSDSSPRWHEGEPSDRSRGRVDDSSSKSKVTGALVITTMNEFAGLKSIWRKIPFECFDRVIVVDAHSTDGTLEFLTDKKCEVILQR
jgi:hypothetical protein